MPSMLHWLPVKAMIQNKSACLCFQSRALPICHLFLSDLLHPYHPHTMSLECCTLVTPSLLTVPRFYLETFGKRSLSMFSVTVYRIHYLYLSGKLFVNIQNEPDDPSPWNPSLLTCTNVCFCVHCSGAICVRARARARVCVCVCVCLKYDMDIYMAASVVHKMMFCNDCSCHTLMSFLHKLMSKFMQGYSVGILRGSTRTHTQTHTLSLSHTHSHTHTCM